MLGAAIVAEVFGTMSMKFSDGFTKLWPSLGAAGGYVFAFWLLAQTLRTIPVSTAYAVWAGAGTALVAAVGMFFIGEPATVAKVAGIALIIGGVVLLNAGGAH